MQMQKTYKSIYVGTNSVILQHRVSYRQTRVFQRLPSEGKQDLVVKETGGQGEISITASIHCLTFFKKH